PHLNWGRPGEALKKSVRTTHERNSAHTTSLTVQLLEASHAVPSGRTSMSKVDVDIVVLPAAALGSPAPPEHPDAAEQLRLELCASLTSALSAALPNPPSICDEFN